MILVERKFRNNEDDPFETFGVEVSNFRIMPQKRGIVYFIKARGEFVEHFAEENGSLDIEVFTEKGELIFETTVS